MDMNLPSLDGWQATEVLKADPATAHIPVIAVSVHVMEPDRLRAHDAGCDSFLAKPCQPMRLVQEIQRVLPPA